MADAGDHNSVTGGGLKLKRRRREEEQEVSHRGEGQPRILDRGTPAILGRAPRRTSRSDNVTTDAAEATTTVPAATSDAV